VLCPVCGRSNFVEIGLKLGSSRVVMRSCSSCDVRWWADSEGSPVELGRVLDLVGRVGRRRRLG